MLSFKSFAKILKIELRIGVKKTLNKPSFRANDIKNLLCNFLLLILYPFGLCFSS